MGSLLEWMFIAPLMVWVMIVGLVFDGDAKRAGPLFPAWVWNVAERSMLAGMLWPIVRIAL